MAPAGPLPSSVKDWTSEDVAIFLHTLGKDKMWNQYARTCVDMGIDGGTLIDATVGILMELGFCKIHANKVLKELQKKIDPKAPHTNTGKPFPTYLPLTEAESDRMHQFGDHYDLMNECGKRLKTAIGKLQLQKKAELAKAKRQFEKIRERVVAERSRCLREIENKHKLLTKSLTGTLQRVENHMEKAEKEEKELNKSMRITNWTERNNRAKTIMTVTQRALEKHQPMLTNEPSVSVKYIPQFEDLLDTRFFDVQYISPAYEMKLTLESEDVRLKKKIQHQEKLQKDMEQQENMKRQLLISNFCAEAKAWMKFGAKAISKRHYAGATMSPDGRYLYLVGGRSGSGVSLSSVEYYSFQDRSWGKLATSMHCRRHGLGVAISPHGKRLYAVGGYDGLNYLSTVEVYEFETGSWRVLPHAMNSKRCGLGVAITGDGKRLYAVGGHDGRGCLDSTEYYDFQNSKWVLLKQRSRFKRHGLGLCISPDNRYLYAVGGHDGSKYLRSVERFDLCKEVWSLLPQSMINNRYGLGAIMSADGHRLYAIGGHDEVEGLNSVEVYDFRTQVAPALWTLMPQRMSRKRCGMGICLSSDGKRIYVVGGGEGACRSKMGDCNMMESLRIAL